MSLLNQQHPQLYYYSPAIADDAQPGGRQASNVEPHQQQQQHQQQAQQLQSQSQAQANQANSFDRTINSQDQHNYQVHHHFNTIYNFTNGGYQRANFAAGGGAPQMGVELEGQRAGGPAQYCEHLMLGNECAAGSAPTGYLYHEAAYPHGHAQAQQHGQPHAQMHPNAHAHAHQQPLQQPHLHPAYNSVAQGQQQQQHAPPTTNCEQPPPANTLAQLSGLNQARQQHFALNTEDKKPALKVPAEAGVPLPPRAKFADCKTHLANRPKRRDQPTKLPHHLELQQKGPPLTVTRRKNASRETTRMLKRWLDDHGQNPYPTKGEKICLTRVTGMSMTQVSTWFANARRRMKKENRAHWLNQAGSGCESGPLQQSQEAMGRASHALAPSRQPSQKGASQAQSESHSAAQEARQEAGQIVAAGRLPIRPTMLH